MARSTKREAVKRTVTAKNATVKKSKKIERKTSRESGEAGVHSQAGCKRDRKMTKTSKPTKGEIAIYGGIVKCGTPEYANWCFWSFWNKLAEYGDQECADEENTPPKYKDISPDEAAQGWKAILEDAAENLRRCAKWELRLFDLPKSCHEKTDDFISKWLDNVESVGHEVDEMMEEFASGDCDEDRDSYADKIMRKLHYGIFVQICWTMNATKDYLREMIEENGWKLGKSGVADDEEAAAAILKLLEDDEIGEGEFADTSKEEAKLKMLQFCPFNKDVIEYCYLDDNGKGPIKDIARVARVDVNPLKKKLLKQLAGDADLSTEDSARDYRAKIVKAAGELELDVSEELAEIDAALKRLDSEYRTVDGREFPSREEADKQRRLSGFEAKLDLSTEEAAIEAKAKLEKFIKKLGVDGAWKMERVTNELDRFDREARRAGDRIFETREEAAKQRELVDFEKRCTITDEASAIKMKADIIAMAKRLGIDGAWKLERVNGELKRFDKLARTAFDTEYQTRDEAAAKRGSSEAFFSAIEAAITSSKDNGFYFKDGIPPKKLVGARTYLSGAQDDGVFAIVDTTIFGSAKIGLVVSRWGIVWKNDTVETTRNAYSWKELASLNTPSKPDRGEITFEKGVVFDFTNSNGDADACRNTLVKLVAFAKEATCLDRLSTVKTAERSADTPDIAEFAKLPCSCIFVEGSIPEKKLRNAFVSMKVQESIDSVRFLIDSTVFGSAKEGLLVTNNAVYFKNLMDDPVRFPFESIESTEAKKNAIIINSKTCQLINVTIDVLERICSYINVVSKTKRR